MKSRVEDGKYVIAGVSFEAKEADSPFEPDSKRYRIIDAVVDSQGANGARFVLEARASTRGMRYVDRNLQSVRAVTRGSGWYLGVMPSEQLVLHKVKADEDMTIGLSRGSVDCFVADERGMEMVDISWPPFEPKMEVEVERGDLDIPDKFWTIKELLEKGRAGKARKIYKKWTVENGRIGQNKLK